MPYKSRAQQGYMHAAAERGEVPKSVVDEFDKASKGKTTKLPEHVKDAKRGEHQAVVDESYRHKAHGKKGSHE